MAESRELLERNIKFSAEALRREREHLARIETDLGDMFNRARRGHLTVEQLVNLTGLDEGTVVRLRAEGYNRMAKAQDEEATNASQ